MEAKSSKQTNRLLFSFILEKKRLEEIEGRRSGTHMRWLERAL